MSKTTLIAGVVFGVLLVAVVATIQEKPERGISRLSIGDVAPDAITRVVASGGRTYELSRTDGGWALADGRPASSAAAERLANAIAKIESSTVVTRSPERFEELEVDEEGGTTIRVYDGNGEVAAFTVGKAARGGANVRVGDEVYLVRGVYESTFRRAADDWTEKSVFTASPDDLREIQVALGDGTTYTLVEQDGTWALAEDAVLPEGFRFDGDQARGFGRSLVSLRAARVLAEDPGNAVTGLGEGADVVTARVADVDSPLEIRLGNEAPEGGVYARASGLEHVVTVPPHVAATLRKAPTDFRDLRVMAIVPDEVVRLRIEEGDRRLVFSRETAADEWGLEESTEETPDGFELDPTKVTSRVAALAYARAGGVADPDVASAFEEAPTSLTVETAAGDRAVLVFGGDATLDGQPAHLARGNADDEVYVVPSYLKANLTGGLETFRRTAPPAGRPNLDPAALQQLPPEVRAQLLQQMAR